MSPDQKCLVVSYSILLILPVRAVCTEIIFFIKVREHITYSAIFILEMENYFFSGRHEHSEASNVVATL